jgi:SAM-dependent methyltransferase
VDPSVFQVEAKIEATHWWFVERRRLFADLIRQSRIPLDADVVDVGTGTGANLRLLKEMGFTRVAGIDPSENAAHWCAEKGLGTVRTGDLCALPLADASVDLVLATDVIEHVAQDGKAVAEIQRVLRPGGTALITVPAFPSLWGLQDVKSHHYRRYRMAPFLGLIEQSGLVIEKKFHFNYLLFAPIYAARQVINLLDIKLGSENEINSPALNRLLGLVFRLDVTTAPFIKPPFGVSILALVHRPREGQLKKGQS